MFRFTFAVALVAALSLSGLFASSALAGNGFSGHSGHSGGHNGHFNSNKKKSSHFNGGNFHGGGNFQHHHHNGFHFQSKNFGFHFGR